MLTMLRPVALWSSDLTRATETAAYLAQATGLSVRVDERLREYAVGLRQGYTFDEFKVAYPEVHQHFFTDPDYHVPGAEEMGDVRSRMTAVLRDVAHQLGPGQTAVVVGHGAALTAGLLGFFDVPTTLREMFAGMDNCAWAILHEHPARGWQLTGYNLNSIGGPRQIGSGENADSPTTAHSR